jgi:O-antigen/teichoic acid export membrane protein
MDAKLNMSQKILNVYGENVRKCDCNEKRSMNSNNKRIAKNTLFLYIRTMFIMLTALITSRVMLNALGFVDYGLNNVIAGVIMLFGFLNNSLGAATSRFLTFELGLNNMVRLKTVFRTAFNIHLGLAIAVFGFCESAGLWIVNNVLTIPPERLFACNVIYQFVIVSTMFGIMQAPFNALIIAHERMKIFAYIGMTNALLQLSIAYLISVTVFDKLIFYGVLHTVAVVGIYVFYHLYSKYRLDGYNLGKTTDKPLLKEMVGYSGWSLFGNVANMSAISLTNILMNIFFGPVINAANAIAQQVSTAVTSFCSNFTMALNPQIVKTYAATDILQMKSLIFRGGKFSFFLLMVFLIPVYLETDILLRLWLKNTPEYTGTFTKLILIFSLVGSYGMTMSMAVQATGKIKYYQITIGGTLLLAFPVTYICYKFGTSPAVAYIGMTAMSLIAVFFRLVFFKKYLGIGHKEYIIKVLWVTFIVFIFSFVPSFYVHENMDESFLRLAVVICVTLLSSGVSIYMFGLTRKERESLNLFIRNKLLNI